MAERTLTQVMVTDRPKAPPNRKILDTPPGDKDLQVVLMGWLHQALVRTARTYVQTILGNLANIGITGAVAVTTVANLTPEQQIALKQAWTALEFWQVLLIALSTAIAPAVIAFLQNTVELLSQLDEMSPKWRQWRA